VKKCALCIILLLTLPAFATITNVQSNAKWTCTGTSSPITCFVVLTTQPTTTGDLLARLDFLAVNVHLHSDSHRFATQWEPHNLDLPERCRTNPPVNLEH